MNTFKNIVLVLLFSLAISVVSSEASNKEKGSKIKVLIVDGQNNHGHWPKVTFMMKQYLEETDLFKVDVRRTAFTWRGDDLILQFPIKGTGKTEALENPKADPDFDPDFSKYDLIICNFGSKAATWPEDTKKNLDKFVSNGGGLVILHAADNSFPKWLAYNKMTGLGGWGGRSEKDGPYVYYNDNDELIFDTQEGRGGAHGPQHEFQIQVRNAEHPITKGMPTKWLHTKDELYCKLRGPAENMEILATTYSAKTGRHEPMLMTLTYGDGRIFHTPMGHADYSVSCVGFITCLLRGSEWAATGKVTVEIPDDFPKADKSSQRVFSKK